MGYCYVGVREGRQLGSAHHLYAEIFMLSQTFPIPVQVQK